MKKRIVALAGEFVHQTTTQLRTLAAADPQTYDFELYESPEALLRLEEADLFIAAGLYWTGSPHVTWTQPADYTPPTEQEKEGLRAYVASGRPVLGFHGGIASFDDWPEFGKLLGFAWHWDITTHGPYQTYRIYPTQSAHPVIKDIEEFETEDENYFNIQLQLGASYQTHLKMDCGPTQQPMLVTLEQHTVGGGKRAYLALGHDLRSISSNGFQKAFWNTLEWLTT